MSRTFVCSSVACLSLIVNACVAEDAPKAGSAAKKNTSSRIASKIEMQPVASLTDEEAEEIAFAAGRTLKHIADAREAIRDGKREAASGHVDQALKLIAIIDSVLPHYKVLTEIKSGKLEYRDEEDVAPRYVTLFDELERRDILSPVKQARQEAGLKERQNGEAPGAIGVSHVDVNYTVAKLDISLTRHMLQRAKHDLEASKAAEADTALLAIQARGVLLEYEEIDLPLEEAADNLKLAEIELTEGRQAEAKAALHLAIDELRRYEQLAGENRSAEVRALHAEITKLTAALGEDQLTEAQRKQAAESISRWWQRTARWFKGAVK